MTLSELSEVVENAVKKAKDNGKQPSEIPVSVQIDSAAGEAWFSRWSDEVSLVYDDNLTAFGCVIVGSSK